ncbi:hypothetical protein MW695_21115 [Alkalihalobacillus sp. APA_J-10(15)]|nr:hypothetical protein [Halalkalibacter sp. APA_J-10(15)]
MIDGQDHEGSNILRRANYQVNLKAEPEDLFEVGLALSSLSESDLLDVEVVDSHILM